MTTTSSTPSDLSVTSKATQADAQLIVAMSNGPAGILAMDGMDVLWGYDEVPTFEQFDRDHPHGSEGARAVSATLAFNETLGTFVKQGLLDRGLVYDLFWVSGAWERCKPIALHYREKAGVPQLYENFEALAAGQV